MSDEREESLPRRRSGVAGGWKDLASSALLIGAVLAILAAGYVLKAERPAQPQAQAGPSPEHPILGSTIVPEKAPEAPASDEVQEPEPEPELATATPAPVPVSRPAIEAPPADPVIERLASRAETDLTRLASSDDPWTAQLLVACRVETVERVIASAKGAQRLFVLPAEVKGEPCFRICWGTYKSSKEAAAAVDLPTALRTKDKPGAAEIAKVTR